VDAPLHREDAEQAVLGSVLINQAAIQDVVSIVKPEQFYNEANRAVYAAMCALYHERADIDVVTVCNRLDGQLADIGGAAYLSDLMLSTPTSMHATNYATIVMQLGTLRQLVAVGTQIVQLAHGSKSSQINEVFTQVQRLVDSATPITSSDSLLLWADSLDAFFNQQLDRCAELDRIASGDAAPRAVFPWSAITHYVDYLREGMLCIIAADSSVGKTTAMECCAEHWARAGLRVAFFHLELSHRFMLDRRAVRHSGESMKLVSGGEVTEAMRDADNRLRGWPGAVHYIHCPGWSAHRIVQKARQMNGRGLADVVIVDYLQKLALGRRRGENKADAIGNALEGQKNGAEQMGIPWLLGSQLSYEGHLRGSKEIEDKSNVVMFLERPLLTVPAHDEYGRVIADVGQRSPQTKVHITKNTAGPTGDAELVMNAARFLMLDKTHPDPPPQERQDDDLTF
jgi:replicative DNA helicase